MKTVIHTAYPKYKGAFISLPADAYLTKSPDFSALKKTIRELLKETDASISLRV